MHPIVMIVLATAAALPLGLWLRHDLAKLTYRAEDEQALPDPGPRWWVVWASILSISGLTTAAALDANPVLYLPLAPLAVAGPGLAAVDFDVMRIPNRVLASTAAMTLLAAAGVAVVEQTRSPLILPVVAAGLTGGILAAVHFVGRGGIGFGDVKLAAVIGLGLGTLGLGYALLAVLVGSVAAAIWARAKHKTGPLAYGPWLLLGAWLAAQSASITG
jgi:leader peptidase (prepilin peptidase)/N-methyltransferase